MKRKIYEIDKSKYNQKNNDNEKKSIIFNDLKRISIKTLLNRKEENIFKFCINNYSRLTNKEDELYFDNLIFKGVKKQNKKFHEEYFFKICGILNISLDIFKYMIDKCNVNKLNENKQNIFL